MSEIKKGDERTDADIWREACKLLKDRKHCNTPDCGWSCCALSAAIGTENKLKDDVRWHRMHAQMVGRFGGSWWWGEPWTQKATAARVDAMLTLVAESTDTPTREELHEPA